MVVHTTADYGPGDLACAEVVQRLTRYLPDAEPVLTPVPPFSTLFSFPNSRYGNSNCNASGRMVSTGHEACRTTPSATLPSSICT
jgi:hypothetical protein